MDDNFDSLLASAKGHFKEYVSLLPRLAAKSDIVEGKIDYSSAINIPPFLRTRLEERSSVGKAVIDILADRIVFQGYALPEDIENEVKADLDEGDFESASEALITDALTYGCAFCLVGIDDNDIPAFTAISPLHVFARFDNVKRKIKTAIIVNGNKVTYYDDEVRATFWFDPDDQEKWETVEVTEHDVLPLTVVWNKNDSAQFGKSELYAGVRDSITHLANTNLRLAVSELLYTSQDMLVLGGDPNLLVDEQGREKHTFSIDLGSVRQILQPETDDEEGNLVLGEKPSVVFPDKFDPSALTKTKESLLQDIAVATSVPIYMLTNVTGLGPESLGILETRLIRASDKRIKAMSRGFREILFTYLLMKYGSLDAEMRKAYVVFAAPQNPTLAAAADAAIKYVQAEVLPADSEVLYHRLGFSRTEIQTIKDELAARRGNSLLDAIRNRPVVTDADGE